MNNNLPGAQLSSNLRRFKRSKKGIITVVGVIVVVLVIIAATTLFLNKPRVQADTTAQTQSTQAVATQTINRDFDFSVKDKTGKVITTFDYKVLDAQLTNEVIINGQKYNPIPGKTFLVVDLQITNNYTQTITIQPRDYVRVMLDGSTEKLAPDIYNDPVDVQAISTKPSKLALAISTADTNIKLQVGEITGTKTIIPLTIHY